MQSIVRGCTPRSKFNHPTMLSSFTCPSIIVITPAIKKGMSVFCMCDAPVHPGPNSPGPINEQDEEGCFRSVYPRRLCRRCRKVYIQREYT
ncbi:hypothetical protein BGZ61DRAFT_210136 [Ilyonectria robusta]|uniref:uncharacterized protein n=1 Tax=Ilyonectria robusta TaxID=1079257 RepID=UPI001E8EE93D|nr:uncharacterized protein BGZ61DRAFT_210136 [Ilyonectria robusta]KAH8714347.1 hypothetical protein BGZ61DRAFT_210136 [Ilyonectria robusta]